MKSPGSNQILELNCYDEGSRFATNYDNGEDLDHLAFRVDNLETAVKGLKEKGVEVVIQPGEIGGWKQAFVLDPNGIWIELQQ